MNLTSLFHRLEIAFWTAWVAALQNAQTRRMVLAGLLLVPAVAIIGLLSAWLQPAFSAADSPAPAAALAQPANPEPALSVEPAANSTGNEALSITSVASGDPASGEAVSIPRGPTARPTNGQSNLLLVVVDELEAASPELHGVWLLARMPALAQVTFMPIYPSIDPDGKSFNARLEDVYRPTRREPLPADFRQALEAQGLWWDHFLVIDEAGLSELHALAGSFETQTGVTHTGEATLQPTSPATDPQGALAYQSQVAREVCAHSTQWAVGSAPVVVATLFTEKAISDLKADDLRLTLRSLRASDGIACQFPILSGR